MAKDYLKNNGYEILQVNWRWQKAEIDLIVIDPESGEIVITEVKARSSSNFGKPEDAVDNKKQKQLIDAAQAFIEEEDIDRECRFDVISVIIGDEIELHHIKEAFTPEF